MGLQWQECISSQTILYITSCTSTEIKILKTELGWTGRVIRMENMGCCQLYYGELGERIS